jgi:hypothetical protein
MILDERTEFCDATALNTGGAGTYNLGDILDTGNDAMDGNSEDLYLVIQVDTAATSGGSATAQFALVSDATTTIATDGSATQHYITPAIAVASLTAGTQVCCVQLPRGTYERYLAVQQVTAVAAFTAGKINAF